MLKLTPTQRGLLVSAATDPRGEVNETGVTESVIKQMIRFGLVISTPKEGGGRTLWITAKGKETVQPNPPPPEIEPTPQSPNPERPKGKIGLLLGLLQRPEGARLTDMTAATGWQPHSVRGALSGIKTLRGVTLTSEKTETGRLYRAVVTDAP